jgi:transcriptional regulator with XRE-family HTH domain
VATKRATGPATATPLGRAIGERLRAIREESGVTQEDVAAEARRLGLGWVRATVAGIELGRRQLSPGELIVLPFVLGRAGVWAYEHNEFKGPDGAIERAKVGHHPVSLADLLPDDERPVLVAGRTQIPGRVLRSLFARWQDRRGWPEAVQTPQPTVESEAEEMALRLPREWVLGVLESVRRRWAAKTPPRDWDDYDERERLWRDVGLEAAGDAERKAAAVLKVPPLAVALAARALWDWSLTAEREHRLAVQLPGLVRDTTPARKLQALRGHITRALVEEMEPVVRSLGKKAAKKRRR